MELFPQIIKDYPQWAICGFYAGTPSEKQPYVWDNEEGKLVPLRKKGTVHGEANLNLLMSYEDAVRCVKYYNQAGHSLNIGFYLMPSDPFCCVDMDLKDTWDDQQKQKAGTRYAKIVETFGSYTEISKSGNGLHMWIYGIPQEGRRRDGVEVYSQYRFIICTGNHWNVSPLTVTGASGSATEAHVANMLHLLLSEMTAINKSDDFEMREYTQEEFDVDPYAIQDQDIYIQLCEQENGNLFKQLWEGRWDVNEIDHTTGERGFASQSEAEFALIDFLCFKTKYNFQVRRLFMYSKMGDRYDDMRRTPGDKIKKPYHLERMIRSYRYDSHVKSLSVKAIVESNVAYALETTEKLRQQTTPEMAPVEIRATDGEFKDESESELNWPPGFTGILAREMYKQHILPNKEFAILSSVAAFSGLCGKAWNTATGSGLNNYFALVARSGTGKEAFKGTISDLFKQVAKRGGKDGEPLHGCYSVIDTSAYVSESALRRGVLNTDSTPNLSRLHYRTEVGQLFANAKQEFSNDKSILGYMRQLYDEGKFDAVSDGMAYSKKENSIAGGKIIAYSFAGETNPQELYDNINDIVMSNGLMSRFIIWEYSGKVPFMNSNYETEYSEHVVQTIGEIYKHAVLICNGDKACLVHLSPEVQTLYNQLVTEKINILNGKDGDDELENEALRQFHSRHGLKCLRISCLLAVADNHNNPVVSLEHWKWVTEFIDLANKRLLDRYKAGEIGESNSLSREFAVGDAILKLVDGKRKGRDCAKYSWFKECNIVSNSDISVCCRNLKQFRNTRGNVDVVNLTRASITGLIEMDLVRKCSRSDLEGFKEAGLIPEDTIIPNLNCYIVNRKNLVNFLAGV